MRFCQSHCQSSHHAHIQLKGRINQVLQLINHSPQNTVKQPWLNSETPLLRTDRPESFDTRPSENFTITEVLDQVGSKSLKDRTITLCYSKTCVHSPDHQPGLIVFTITANFKYKRDLCSFARVSYLYYVSNFKVMYITFYITFTWLNSFSGEKVGITLWGNILANMTQNVVFCHIHVYAISTPLFGM